MSFIVKIEFGGIQRFIFDVPRLAVMRGANALLGQVIRQDLVNLAGTHNCSAPAGKFELDGAIEGDPLGGDDDPNAMWQKGILSRDGGHFTAHFSEKGKAKAFIKEATAHIAKELPGITVQVKCHELDSEGNLIEENSVSSSPTDDSYYSPQLNIPPLPVFQPCQLSHEGVAQEIARKSNDDKFWVSSSVSLRHEQGKAKSNKPSQDVGSLLIQGLSTLPNALEKAEELNHLAGDDYLALIVADGNNMGNRAKAYLKNKSENEALSYLEKDALFESFYHAARVAMRKSVKAALTTTFEKFAFEETRPFELFMLGGDDLMLACRAKYALPLVSEIANKLQSQNLRDGEPLSMGFGVAIAKAALPMHRLHHVAEALASSAKVKWRGLPKAQQRYSTVDWEVITQAWVDEPIDARLQNHIHKVNNKTLLTTAKPYLCSAEEGTGNGNTMTLDRLLEADDSLQKALQKEGAPARSQMLNALSLLPQGELASTIAWQKVPPNTRHCVEQAMQLQSQGDANTAGFPWMKIDNDPAVMMSYYADLMEVHELKNKLRRMSNEKMGKEVNA
ncbi:hypothetical protein KIH87_11825 [Paraneptunicella aestuarii]|uniref:Cas10/Cmr2 second palm domain-containing protein n=1 Tax=Paraneptunicella aestuarii TaxID=2831148 RepID=UPI001E575A06|nr:hypothetical protein [Paraneptunicella aestuarii]UAA37403.1 hypothetical protein KIH87_11825 [Paraneptunicella aestuarii]